MNYFFLYNLSDSNIYGAPYLGSADEWTNIPIGCGVLGPIAQTDTTAQDAHAHPERYKVENDRLVVISYFTLTSVLSTTTANEYTITATLNNPPFPAPTNVSFTIAGAIFTTTLTNNQTTITVDLHKVVAGQSIPVQVSVIGCVSGSINIGGTATASSNLKAVTQTNGNVLLKCTSKQEVTAYYMAHTVSQSDILTDLANLIDLHSDMLNKLMTQAQVTSYAPLTLSADEVHAVQDFTANYIDKLRLKLADASPAAGSTTTQNPRYPNVIAHKQLANTTADEYLSVISDPDVR